LSKNVGEKSRTLPLVASGVVREHRERTARQCLLWRRTGRPSGSFGPLGRPDARQSIQPNYWANGGGARCRGLRAATALCEGWTSAAS